MKKLRQSYDVSEAEFIMLERLRADTKSATFAELFRKSNKLMRMITDHQATGGKIIFRDVHGKDEIVRII